MAASLGELGDTVTLSDLFEDWEVQGVIIGDNTDEGTYLVSVPVLGQVLLLDGEGKPVEV